MNCPGYDRAQPTNIPCTFRVYGIAGMALSFVTGCYLGWVFFS